MGIVIKQNDHHAFKNFPLLWDKRKKQTVNKPGHAFLGNIYTVTYNPSSVEDCKDLCLRMNRLWAMLPFASQVVIEVMVLNFKLMMVSGGTLDAILRWPFGWEKTMYAEVKNFNRKWAFLNR